MVHLEMVNFNYRNYGAEKDADFWSSFAFSALVNLINLSSMMPKSLWNKHSTISFDLYRQNYDCARIVWCNYSDMLVVLRLCLFQIIWLLFGKNGSAQIYCDNGWLPPCCFFISVSFHMYDSVSFEYVTT